MSFYWTFTLGSLFGSALTGLFVGMIHRCGDNQFSR